MHINYVKCINTLESRDVISNKLSRYNAFD